MTKDKKNKNILICGAYGFGNAGDDAILESIMASLRDEFPNYSITVISRNPKETSASCGAKSVYSLNPFGVLSAMKKATLFISGGGSLIQDATSKRSLLYYLYSILFAKKLGCKVIMYGCGVGPVTDEKNRKLTAKIINKCVDSITLRDANSEDDLKSMGVTGVPISITADPVFSWSPNVGSKIDDKLDSLGLNVKYAVFALRNWQGYSEKTDCFAKAADYVYEKYGLCPVFLPLNINGDPKACEEVASKLTVPCIQIKETFDAKTTFEIIRRAKLVVSVRLHALIFAASAGVPFAAVSYDPKVSSFMEYQHKDACINLEDVTEEKIKNIIDLGMNETLEDLLELRENMQELEVLNVASARKLIGEEILNDERINIKGLPLDKVTMKQALNKFEQFLSSDKCNVIVTPNSEILSEACKNEKLADVIKDADLVIPDGISLVYASKMLGQPLPERVTGIDFCQKAFDILARKDGAVYILGSKPGVAETAAKNLEKEYGGLRVVGARDGYFKEDEEAEIIDEINRSGAQFLCVALGSPKQELFMAKYKDKLNVKVCAGIGGSVDVWSGNTKRAPQFYQEHGLEWLYRLIGEPWRFKRMAKIPVFLLSVMFDK